MTRAVQENRTVGLSADCILIRRDGVERVIEDSAAPICDRRGLVIGAVIVFHDISMAHSVVKKMAHLAQHDALTELPNRLLFSDRVAQAIALAHRHNQQCAVLFIDLDHFKIFNDSQGHFLGDLLLRSIAKRLLACVRDSDTVGRQGGDEFVALLSEINRQEDAARVAEKLLGGVGKTVQSGRQDVSHFRKHRNQPLPGGRQSPGGPGKERGYGYVSCETRRRKQLPVLQGRYEYTR